ncbi:putative glycolipid-binding domain-containing protein [Pseudonocardia sp. NPDC049635]|uniref:putative glycolipid-binding domain-containing protein n=1 Tax=Pseudonocardia sp. NPDC049635 TaxID=3155506 RepID=UPI0033E727E0
MAIMLSWRSEPDTGGGLESARITTAGGGFRAVGRMIRGVPGLPGGVLTASYRLVVAGDGSLSRLAVDVATAGGEQQLTISRSTDGVWLVDDGSGGTRGEFHGARDVDLAFSPVFDALPIRRLGLHRDRGEHVVPMVVVDLPTLRVEATEQVYRTVRAGTAAEPAVVGFEAGGVSAQAAGTMTQMTVDDDGFVIDYPGLAARTELPAG